MTNLQLLLDDCGFSEIMSTFPNSRIGGMDASASLKKRQADEETLIVEKMTSIPPSVTEYHFLVDFSLQTCRRSAQQFRVTIDIVAPGSLEATPRSNQALYHYQYWEEFSRKDNDYRKENSFRRRY
jgi:hypothetical protein